ncbi:MAG: 4Fe-4S binding protein [Myxococcota bacterium]|nr:4Fe-4S binding protein [Myxococcota bacterium]
MGDYNTPAAIRAWWRPWMGYVLAMIGFSWATVGFFNVYFSWGLPRAVFNQHSEIFVIAIYGVPTILLIKDPYQKRRLAVLVTLVFTFWYLVPTLWPFEVDAFGSNRPWAATFPGFDVPGTWTNLGLFVAALLFGRRIKCGWMNTCVAIKETAGAPFRKHTKRGTDWFKLRRIKLLTGAIYLSYFAVLFMPDSAFTRAYFYWFWTIMITVYFGSLFLAPIFGARTWCRWLCPILFGWANVLGFYRLRVDKDRCTSCGKCEQVCDFGLPIRALAEKNPMIRTTECMGCGRCRTACGKDAISYYDVRDFVREKILGQDPAYKSRQPNLAAPMPVPHLDHSTIEEMEVVGGERGYSSGKSSLAAHQ